MARRDSRREGKQVGDDGLVFGGVLRRNGLVKLWDVPVDTDSESGPMAATSSQNTRRHGSTFSVVSGMLASGGGLTTSLSGERNI